VGRDVEIQDLTPDVEIQDLTPLWSLLAAAAGAERVRANNGGPPGDVEIQDLTPLWGG
jgi:hypothetical protein